MPVRQPFTARRQADWLALEDLIGRADRRLGALGPADIDRLGALYRRATADLALVRRDQPDSPLAMYLNGLVARAHARVYRSAPLSRQAVVDFYRHGFPRLYRRILPFTAAAFLLFAIPAVVAFVLSRRDTDVLLLLFGDGMMPLIQQVERGEMWTEITPAMRSAAASGILTNNISVTFKAFGGGILLGLLTVWVMVQNGLLIGGIFGLLDHHGMAPRLLDFIAGHGPVELSVIFAAGGAGLFMGDAILRPGLRRRVDALADRARDAALLVLGSAPLLVGAGLIEGFVSPSALPTWIKAVVGLGTGAALHTYWLVAGRQCSGDDVKRP
ncbi:MAG: stage II sporulation protein M [Ardenticatenales bacterium]|nr:stage II sporulation protein M [Ardenticatenales bacterium]